jgi:hypothetical protein
VPPAFADGTAAAIVSSAKKIPGVRVILPPKLAIAGVAGQCADSAASPGEEMRSGESCAKRPSVAG